MWRTWAGEARCFCGLLSGLNGVCSGLLGSCHVSSSLWPCKPSFCYSGFVSVLLEILQSVTFLWRLRVLHLLLLWLSWVLIIAFLPSVFQAQDIQVGSVYIGNTSGKLVLVRSRADDGTSGNFFPFDKCLGVVHCFLLRCFWETWSGHCEHFSWPEFLRTLFNNQWCWTLDVFKKSWFVSWLVSAVLRNCI